VSQQRAWLGEALGRDSPLPKASVRNGCLPRGPSHLA